MSPAFGAHPEFGYFCLSQSFRRKARNVLVSTVAVGVVAGALVLWARDDQGDGALTIARVDDVPSSIDATSVVDQATATTTAERTDPPAVAKAACDGDNWTYLDGKCVMRRAPKPGSLAAATDKPEIAPIPANASSLPSPAATPPAPKREDAAIAAKATEPASFEPIGQTAPVQKAGRKTLRSQAGGRDQDRTNSISRDGRSREHQRSARTYTSSDDRSRQMPSQTSAMRWARQLQECIGAVRCRVGEQLLRAFLSGGI
jgi:hypothetical protein